MSEMVEKMARAMFDSDYPGADFDAPDLSEVRDDYRRETRAALAVLLEPDAAMIAAGEKRMRQHGTARQVFRAMIEAAQWR